ncbi:unnamed protein product [Brachionus calyciflorus]|uniref:GH16 domain-containing protein n=1 Tax=Brachionus calyciflorus TaxID=104777 RepID=A0A814KHC7_9BILA|nr:unnamed protein product [Brachionus calyciflorus]
MSKLLFSSVLIIALVNFSSCQIQWNGNWAFSCDFIGNDIGSATVPGEQCSSRCSQTSGCTHFTWTNWNGGTCWMKKGNICKSDAIWTGNSDSVCGVLSECSNFQGSNIESLKGALLWSDEFDSQSKFESNWVQETGGHGWGNRELQYYTNNNENTEISNGMLTIHTRKEWKNNMRFTSARLLSSRKFRYGVFEMRAKLPFGRGTWPAFWLLASKRPLDWPSDGEIDIMEHVGYDPNVVHATIHCKSFNHLIGTQVGRSTRVDDVFNQFHLYQLYWSDKSIRGYVDGQQYFQYDRPANSDSNSWPFDNEFDIILNTAVGGDWGGALGIDENIYPQKFVIDYVRHYAHL